MADFTGSTTVSAEPQAVFDLLADVSNLPRYFARMTSVEALEGEQVRTAAEMPDGETVEGDAWFRSDQDTRTITWASQGPDDYRGSIEISDQPGGTRIAVHLHTTRVSEGDDDVRQGLDATLEGIVGLLEEEGLGGGVAAEAREAAQQREAGVDPADADVDAEAAGHEAAEAAHSDQAEDTGEPRVQT